MAELTDVVTMRLTLGEINEVLSWGQRNIASTQQLISKLVIQAQETAEAPEAPSQNQSDNKRQRTGAQRVNGPHSTP